MPVAHSRAVTIKNIFRHGQIFPGDQNCPTPQVENHTQQKHIPMCIKETYVRICTAALLITAKYRKSTQMPITSRMNKLNVVIRRLKYYTVMTMHFNSAQEYGCISQM